MANVSLKVVLGMLFLTLSNADIDFLGQERRWKTYTNKEVLPTIRRVELVRKKEFAAAALNPKHETYVVHIASFSSTPLAFLESTPLNVHISRRSQISGLIVEEAPTKVSNEYSDFTNVFSPDLASKLPEHNGIIDYAIELVKGCQQPPYRPIYNLEPVKLETLKAYIKTNLANGFIRPFKSSAGALIPFDRKSDGSLWLCVDYQGLNNLTIKNRYSLPLIKESLDRLGGARQFT